MPNLSKTYQCLWNLSKGNLHRIYLYENAFDFLVNNFNQKLFQDQVNGIIYSGTPCILLLPCSRVISKRTYVEFMHVASFLRVRVGEGGSLIPEILKSMGWGGGVIWVRTSVSVLISPNPDATLYVPGNYCLIAIFQWVSSYRKYNEYNNIFFC